MLQSGTKELRDLEIFFLIINGSVIRGLETFFKEKDECLMIYFAALFCGDLFYGKIFQTRSQCGEFLTNLNRFGDFLAAFFRFYLL